MANPRERSTNFLEWGSDERYYKNKTTGEVTRVQRKYLRADRFGKAIVLLVAAPFLIYMAIHNFPALFRFAASWLSK